jgi:hypothetical protein
MQPFVFIFWQSMTYCSKKYPFVTAFQLPFKETFTRGKQVDQLLIETTAYRRKASIGGW